MDLYIHTEQNIMLKGITIELRTIGFRQ